MVISASLQAWGVVFPFAMLTSICRSIVTICSGLYLLIGMTRFSSKWILSHSTWYKFRRSGQDMHSSWGYYLRQYVLSFLQEVRAEDVEIAKIGPKGERVLQVLLNIRFPG